MSWIESHQKLKEDPKAAAVAAAMGWNLHECIGRLHCLWWWCVDHCEDGDLRRYNDAVIASAAGVAVAEAGRFVESMVAGCGTAKKPDGFFEREPYFRLRNWWKFTRRFMQKRYERSPEKWRAIARAYGSREAGETVEPAAEPTADSTNQPTNQPTHQALEADRGGGGEVAGGESKRARKPVVTGRFPVPQGEPLPVPLFPKTAKDMLEAVEEVMRDIKRTAKKTPRIVVLGGQRVQTGTEFEPEAEAALELWRERLKEIKRAVAG